MDHLLEDPRHTPASPADAPTEVLHYHECRYCGHMIPCSGPGCSFHTAYLDLPKSCAHCVGAGL